MKHVVTCKIKILTYILLNKTCDSFVQSKGRCKSLQNILQHMLEGVIKARSGDSVSKKQVPALYNQSILHTCNNKYARYYENITVKNTFLTY